MESQNVSKTPSRLVAALLATSVFLSMAAPVEARVGGGRSSSSSSMSRSSGSYNAPATAPSRVGGGSASGMQRPEVMDRVRSGQSGAAPGAQPGGFAAPAAGAAGAGAAGAAGAQAARPGSSGWVAPALTGAAVGAVAGYALSEATRPNAPAGGGNYNNGNNGNGGAMGPVDGAGNAIAPGYGAPASHSGGNGFLWLLAGLLGVGAFYLWRRNSAARASVGSVGGNNAFRTASVPPAGTPIGYGPEAEELQRFAPAFFKTMQDVNNAGNVVELSKYATPMMFEQMKLDIESRGGPANTQVIDMRAEVVDFTRNADGTQVASLRYLGHVSESADRAAEPVDEVWHLIRERGDGWRLAGIEQV